MKLKKQDKKILLGLSTLILKNNTEILKVKVTTKKDIDSALLMTFIGAGEVICTVATTLVQASLNKDTKYVHRMYDILLGLLDRYISMCVRNEKFILDEEYIATLITSLVYLKEIKDEDRV
jgi:hypothetical protein